jgi:hypothetical protein
MKILLVCGYRRTGKDSLCNILAGETVHARFAWRIYKHPDKLDFPRDKGTRFCRTGFADTLKKEASVEYGIPLVISDSDKDVKQFTHHQTGAIVSARDIYIEWGAIRRSQDPDYWCKVAFDAIEDTTSTVCVVTDWRFPNEAEYVIRNFSEVVSARVYRSEVPEPPSNIESEHALDNYSTDFLLIQDGLEEEFEKAVKRFPQYCNYVPCGTV